MKAGKQAVVLVSVLLWGLGGYGQKCDYVWLQGYTFSPKGYDTSDGYLFGTSIMNFNYTPVTANFDTGFKMNFEKTNTSYCNNSGNLLFCTNGLYIDNSFSKMIEGSDSINQGYYWSDWYPIGYRIPQGILAFQKTTDSSEFYILHSYFDNPYESNQGSLPFIYHIFNSLIDMSANSGLGEMKYVNQSIIEDTLGSDLVATRHGNGRDWWVPVLKYETNCFYRILLTDTGFELLPDLNCGGPVITFYDYGSSAFSSDGTKFAHFTIETGLTIFDFDRCTGELSNSIYIPSNIWGDSGWICSGLAFSPNSRFLYLSATNELLQYDMWANDIASSVDTVGIYDGYYAFDDPTFETVFNTAQLGPDGKIYISCGNSVPVYHVISDPNLKGDSCNFQQHALSLPSSSLGVPNFPNYRLGPLIGSPCDTLTGLNEVARAQKESILKIFPNPATDIVTIDYGFTNWSISGVISLVIVNELGQVVYSQPVPQYSGYQQINVSRYASGVYTAYVKRNEMVVSEQKFAKF